MRYLLAALILIHGLIHFMGFSKAFGLADMKQLSIPISKPIGLLWLVTALLFVLSATTFHFKSGVWMYTCIIACVLSQVIIVLSLKEAKYGTIANGILLLIALLSLTTRLFEQSYKDIEFVFVNDCTQDRSIEVLQNVIKDYPQRESQIHIICHKQKVFLIGIMQ